MIPRYQRVIFYILVGGIVFMAAALLRGCQRSHQRIAAMRDQSPIAAPSDLPEEQIQVALANDADNTISLDQVSLPLPDEDSLKARVVLDKLLADDALPGSNHPLPAGPSVTDVFLLALPVVTPGNDGTRSSRPSSYGKNHVADAQLMVVNLAKTFADRHPSGIETEDLTLRSILATIQADFPHVEEVRFLVDGEARETLAGHADLMRPYPVSDSRQIHVLSPDGSPL